MKKKQISYLHLLNFYLEKENEPLLVYRCINLQHTKLRKLQKNDIDKWTNMYLVLFASVLEKEKKT